MEKLGYIKRVHGGAIFLKEEKDIPLSIREDLRTPLKKRIAERAESFIHEGDFVILDAGSTTLEIARKLLTRKNLTVITNAINRSYMPFDNQNIDVIVPGGDLRHSTDSLVGPATVQFLQSLQVNHAFIGCSGISLRRGFMNLNMVESEVKKATIEVADRITVVADYTKFSEITLISFAPFHQVDSIITNNELDNKMKERLSCLRTKLIYV